MRLDDTHKSREHNFLDVPRTLPPNLASIVGSNSASERVLVTVGMVFYHFFCRFDCAFLRLSNNKAAAGFVQTTCCTHSAYRTPGGGKSDLRLTSFDFVPQSCI